MSPQQHNSLAADCAQPHQAEAGPPLTRAVAVQEFSSEERALLLRLAHDSIASALELREISLHPPSPHLAEFRGAFTSLYLRHDRGDADSPSKDQPNKDQGDRDQGDKELRGCVGYVLPTCTVYRAVAETARAAAFDDNRFPPVTKEEAPRLAVELSILSPPQPTQPEEIEIGRHGLLISQHGQRGLLLPQVPIEHKWDRKTFLEQTCRKAGLPPNAWLTGAMIEAFTAEVFGEKSGP